MLQIENRFVIKMRVTIASIMHLERIGCVSMSNSRRILRLVAGVHRINGMKLARSVGPRTSSGQLARYSAAKMR